jgi:hypothetical protein
MGEQSQHRLATLAPASRAAVLVGASAFLLAVGAAASPLTQLPPRPQPALQCPSSDPTCLYAERRLTLDGYRYQMMMLSGGADWDNQFWVSDGQGQLLLIVPPMRGNAWLAVRTSGTAPDANEPTPPVRVINDHYAPTDAGCCPSGFSSTIYNYDPARHALIAEQSVILPRAALDPLKQTLSAEGWTLVFPTD